MSAVSDDLRAELLDWVPRESGSLRGYVKVRFADGIELAGISIHQMDGKTWPAPPDRPWFDARGKMHYAKIVSFANAEARRRWNRDVIEALLQARPGALGDGVIVDGLEGGI